MSTDASENFTTDWNAIKVPAFGKLWAYMALATYCEKVPVVQSATAFPATIEEIVHLANLVIQKRNDHDPSLKGNIQVARMRQFILSTLASHSLPLYSSVDHERRRAFCNLPFEQQNASFYSDKASFDFLFSWEMILSGHILEHYAASDRARAPTLWNLLPAKDLLKWLLNIKPSAAQSRWSQLELLNPLNFAEIVGQFQRRQTQGSANSTVIPSNFADIAACLTEGLPSVAPPPHKDTSPHLGVSTDVRISSAPSVFGTGFAAFGRSAVNTGSVSGLAPTFTSSVLSSTSGAAGSSGLGYRTGTVPNNSSPPGFMRVSHSFGSPITSCPFGPRHTGPILGEGLFHVSRDVVPGPQGASMFPSAHSLADIQGDLSSLRAQLATAQEQLRIARTLPPPNGLTPTPPSTSGGFQTTLYEDTLRELAEVQRDLDATAADTAQGITSAGTPRSSDNTRKLMGVEFLDDDMRKHIVFRPSLAYDNAPKSNFIRRMTDPLRLIKGMSGEGLLLDAAKFRTYLLSQARHSTFGISTQDPVWATEYELSNIATLPVLRPADFEKLLEGKISKLAMFLDSGTVTNLAQLERALKNIERVFVTVFHRAWRGCNATLLAFLQTPEVRLIPTGFPVTYLEMAIGSFNRLVSDKYVFNSACPTHPASLGTTDQVMQLWHALTVPMIATCRDPIQLQVYYRLYGFNHGPGRSSDRDPLADWDRVPENSGKRKSTGKSAANSDSDASSVSGSATKLAASRQKKLAKPKRKSKTSRSVSFEPASSEEEVLKPAIKKAKGAKRDKPSKNIKVKLEKPTPSKEPLPKSEDYCIATLLHILDLGPKCIRGGAKCRYKHVSSRASIDVAKFATEIKSSAAKVLTPEKRKAAKTALGLADE